MYKSRAIFRTDFLGLKRSTYTRVNTVHVSSVMVGRPLALKLFQSHNFVQCSLSCLNDQYDLDLYYFNGSTMLSSELVTFSPNVSLKLFSACNLWVNLACECSLFASCNSNQVIF